MKNLILILTAFLLLGCRENNDKTTEDVLPPITQTGNNTAGCIINGKIIIPKDGINGTSGFPVSGLSVMKGSNFYFPILGNDYFSLKIANLRDKGKSYWIYLHMNNLQNGVGEYTIGQGVADVLVQTNHPYIFARETNNGISSITYLSSDNSGKIIISKLTNSICSGTFSGTLYNMDNPLEKIQVTDGRFDIKIQ